MDNIIALPSELLSNIAVNARGPNGVKPVSKPPTFLDISIVLGVEVNVIVVVTKQGYFNIGGFIFSTAFNVVIVRH